MKTPTISKPKSLQKLFHPRSVAVIGASQDQKKVGHAVLRNLKSAGFPGSLFAVNPKYEHVDSVPCSDTIEAIEEPIDLAIICTPARTVAQIVEQCGRVDVNAVIILTAGFQETGKQGHQLQSELELAASKYPEMRIIGPNCVGVINTASKLNASFARGMPLSGRISFISQSGALCTSVLDWALDEKIGLANSVSIGNMVETDWGDLIDYFADDENTDALVLYVEAVKDANRFVEAVSRCVSRKPVIAYKAGRFQQSAAAAASHTGALAGEDVVYETVFRRLGIQRVYSVEEMFDSAEVLARVQNKRLRNRPNSAGNREVTGRLGIVSNAGGPAVMATDALIEYGGTLVELSEGTISALNDALPPNWSKQNPVDVLGDATPDRLARATQLVLEDDNVDAVLVIVSPQAMTEPMKCAEAILEIASQHHKPILTSWMGGATMRESVDCLNLGGLSTFPTPERAVKAYLNLARYQQPPSRTIVATTRESSTQALSKLPTEVDAKAILSRYSIDVVPTKLADTELEATALAREFGFPVALKIASPEISHKSDFGGVQLNLNNEEEVKLAYREVITAAHEHHPQSIIMGVSVQPMIDVSKGYELIAGIKRDPVFGPVVMVGTGGVNAEVFQDVAFELPPLDNDLAASMLKSLKSWPILNGFRGQPVLNTESVVDALIKLAHLSLAHPEIKELDINPLLVTPNEAIALDARVILLPHHRVDEIASQ